MAEAVEVPAALTLCVSLQACREGELTRKLQEEQFCLLQCAVVEAEGIILDAMAKIDDPIHVRCTSSPGTENLLCLPSSGHFHNQIIYLLCIMVQGYENVLLNVSKLIAYYICVVYSL